MGRFDQSYVDTEVGKWVGILARIVGKTATTADASCIAEFVTDRFSDVAGEYSDRNAGMIADGIERWQRAALAQPAPANITR